MTFKELKNGSFFIPSVATDSRLRSKFGSVLMKKTDNREVCSMSSGASFPVHHKSAIIKPNESVIKINFEKVILERCL
jgi:hypothetical protein